MKLNFNIIYQIQEMNGSSKYSSLPSPIVPEPTNEKSFYNPFTVDLSLDNINQPTTGA